MRLKNLILYFCVFIILSVLNGCAKKIALFNGQNLDGWKPVLEVPDADPADVWSVQDGVLRCEGKPTGYIRTVKDYSNYKLHLEWRWVDEPTNSGVLLHTNGEDQLWPLSVEAQLMHGNAGDLITIQRESAVTAYGVRCNPPEGVIWCHIHKQHDSSENPPGQWNSYDIVCEGDTIRLTVNGILQNFVTESNLASGAICLQSEGSPIEFRNVRLTSLK